MIDFLASAWDNAVETAAYLLAYHYVLVMAPAAHLALVAGGPGRRGWLEGRRGWWAAAVLGVTEPLSREGFERNLRRLESPGAAVVYLGISHTIVAFFCAATAAPTRWRLYARTFGRRRAVRLVAILVVAALLAGLATAGIFGLLGLSIHYKLIPQQLWQVP